MSTAAERAAQLALVSRLKTIYPEVSEWPAPDEITHDHWLAYMKTSHDVGGEFDYPHSYENKEEEQWELMTYVLCEVLGWRGIWVSEERRRLANVDVGRSTSDCPTTAAGCGRWDGCSLKRSTSRGAS